MAEIEPVVDGEVVETDWGNSVAGHDHSGAGSVPVPHASTSGQTANDHHAQDHHARHEPAGADAMAVDAAAGTGSLRTLGTGAAQAAAGNHSHGALDFGESGDIAASAVGDTVAAGSTGEVADAGHRHARESFGNPVAVDVSNAAGASTSVSRAGHTHKLQGPALQAKRGVSTGTVASAGNAQITVTWDTAFGDANYTVVAIYNENANLSKGVVCSVKSKAAGSCVINVANDTAASRTGTLDVIAVHD